MKCLACNKPVNDPVWINEIGPFHDTCTSKYFQKLIDWTDGVEQIEEGDFQ